jgi:bacterioferritin
LIIYNVKKFYQEIAMASRNERRAKIIEVLNRARSMELQAIHQYMNQHYNLANMDYGELAANIKLIAIDEMRHAEQFAERIKELGGEPTTDSPAVEKGQDVEAIFTFDSTLEDDTIDDYNSFLEICRENGDSTSMKIFEEIIDEELEHFNYFDSIKGHLEKLGAAYLARIAGTPADSGPPSKGFITGVN